MSQLPDENVRLSMTLSDLDVLEPLHHSTVKHHQVAHSPTHHRNTPTDPSGCALSQKATARSQRWCACKGCHPAEQNGNGTKPDGLFCTALLAVNLSISY